MWLRFSHRSREALARLGWPRPFVKEHRDSNEVSGEFKGMYATAPVRESRQNRPFVQRTGRQDRLFGGAKSGVSFARELLNQSLLPTSSKYVSSERSPLPLQPSALLSRSFSLPSSTRCSDHSVPRYQNRLLNPAHFPRALHYRQYRPLRLG